jgi:hypothetical protein
MIKPILFCIALGALIGCADDSNISDCDTGKKQIPCTEKSAEEKGRLALDDRKFELAAENFLLAIDGNPENYNLYTLLATSYAGAAGFNLLDVTKAQMGGDGSIIDIMNSFLPTPAKPCINDAGEDKVFTLCISSMEEARAAANLPEAALADTAADFVKTAQKQQIFYGSASTVMQINRFIISSDTGAFDPAQLETMTEEDAVNILNTLASTGALSGLTGEESAVLQEKIAEAHAQILAEPGGSTKEKLAAFLAKDEQAEAQ